ncbi:MAG: endolytic transglycosylase MltG [Pseudomonadota bacterium]
MVPRSPRELIEPEKAPPLPQRSRRSRHPIVVILNFFMTLSVLAVLALGGLFYWGKVEFESAGPLRQDKTVLIQPGTASESIANILERQGIISNRWVFSGAVRAYKANNQLKAGEYLFKSGSTMRDVMETIVQGKSILHSVTFPEGWTSAQMVERIRANPVLTGSIEEVPPEGSLLPETYRFTRGETRQELLDRIKRAQAQVVADVWERRSSDLPIETPEDMVILASIVEKETGRSDERTRVAGVFVNRINRSMRLESDPTILYGLYKGEAWMQPRTIFRSDLRKPNPYNTYQIDGLPPGPIGNPGRAALEAVANPSRTNDIFFVADGTGGHVFAETLEEHNRNVARWRRIERERREKRAQEQNNAPASQESTEPQSN